MEGERECDTCNRAIVHLRVPVPAFFVCVLWAGYGDVLAELGNDKDGYGVLPHALTIFSWGTVPPVLEVALEDVCKRFELFQSEDGALPSSTRHR